MKSFVISVFLVLGSLTLNAQSYFQQEINYRIQVTLDDNSHELSATMELEYINHSPDTLHELYIHLWPNAYCCPGTDLDMQKCRGGEFDLHYSTEAEQGSIKDLAFKVNGEALNFSYLEGNLEIAHLELTKPLAPGEQLQLSTPFSVEIPSGKFSRLGHIGQSYQITQWYPKPVVYDANGWHPMSYLNQGEFYSEFGSFEVEITLPDNYTIGATGILQNEEERERLLGMAEQTKKGAWKNKDNSFPASSSALKTLKYSQDSVHDFAWFADKRFNVLYKEFELEDSGRKVDGWVFFTNKHADAWAKSMEYLVDGTKHYSKLVGDYPYSQVSVVDGTLSAGGGMEYPMVTVINGTSDALRLERVVVHEVGHNWFYGILGSNERDNPWMDEGINSYYEQRYFEEKYSSHGARIGALLSGQGENMADAAYLYSACRHQDQGLEISSDSYSGINYGTMVYMKGAKIMSHLNSVLGEKEYDRVMQSYFQDWKFKHPQPSDMKQSLEGASGQNLDWFFENLAQSSKKVNHRISSFNKTDSSVEVKSTTSYSGPISVGFYSDTTLVDLKVGTGKSFSVSSPQPFDWVKVDPLGKGIQLNRRDDEIRTSGLLKKWNFPELKPVIGVGNAPKPSIYYSPVLGWNENNKWMFGGYLSNSEILFKKREWSVVPLYSVASEDIVGMFEIRQSIFPKEESPSRVDISLNGKRFSIQEVGESGVMYAKLLPGIKYQFEDPSQQKGKHKAYYNLHYIDIGLFGGFDVSSNFLGEEIYHNLGYEYFKGEGLIEQFVSGDLEMHKTYQKVTASSEISGVYDVLKNKWRLRVYGGKMWYSELVPLGARLSINGQDGSMRPTAIDDYRFDHLFIARNNYDGLKSQQIVRNRGGFVQSSAYGDSDNWVATLNGEVDLPIKLPISIFANLGFTDGADNSLTSFYEGGARFTLIENFCDISFPFFYSKDIREYLDFRNVKYGETIRFQLKLETLSLRKLIDELKL